VAEEAEAGGKAPEAAAKEAMPKLASESNNVPRRSLPPARRARVLEERSAPPKANLALRWTQAPRRSPEPKARYYGMPIRSAADMQSMGAPPGVVGPVQLPGAIGVHESYTAALEANTLPEILGPLLLAPPSSALRPPPAQPPASLGLLFSPPSAFFRPGAMPPLYFPTPFMPGPPPPPPPPAAAAAAPGARRMSPSPTPSTALASSVASAPAPLGALAQAASVSPVHAPATPAPAVPNLKTELPPPASPAMAPSGNASNVAMLDLIKVPCCDDMSRRDR